ncbi:protein eva-1 C [Caerostris extrusa]|uniref:Protein eva-1 C n=1 Tax=Caerostris extrusa TaxID=172846 RepID=A0AAV4UY66_CAEEX|nr:protein eva-1 C [Caerostris extrusa]
METWHRTLTPFQSHACDDEELHLRCTPSTLISIHYVFYGRLAESGHLCPDRSTAFFSTACGSSKALQVVHDRCHKQRACRLYISKDTFRDDPCPDVRKFIEVMYKCRPDSFMNKIVCEGGQLDLFCPHGQGLTIFSASYGTTKEGVVECRQRGGFEPEDCLIGRADETVRSLCFRKNCSLKVDDRTFGNPGCKGTKYLKVSYNCDQRVTSIYNSLCGAGYVVLSSNAPYENHPTIPSDPNSFSSAANIVLMDDCVNVFKIGTAHP